MLTLISKILLNFGINYQRYLKKEIKPNFIIKIVFFKNLQVQFKFFN